jgi:nucleoid-associated protein YgaU
MRKARVLFLLLVILLAGAYVGIYGLHSGWFAPATAPERSAGAPREAPEETRTPATRPSFDIVRAEPDGSVIMAGRAEPGWTVSVESGGKEVGRAVADNNGEWIIEPSRKLTKGEHSLELRSQTPGGGRTLFSKQRLALSLSDVRKDQPLVALTEEGKSTRVLQMPPPSIEEARASDNTQQAAPAEAANLTTPAAAPDQPSPSPNPAPSHRIGFASVDYEEGGDKSMLHMSGQASPGARVMLYVDNQFQGSAAADATGSWSFSANRLLAGGSHALRADLIEKDSTKVVSRAEVKFDRSPPVAVASVNEDKAKAIVSDEPPTSLPAARPVPNAATGTTLIDNKGAVIVVRSGDTLWQIAERHYGSGAKYTQIFQNNRQQIRDPNWIYPSQRFELPE